MRPASDATKPGLRVAVLTRAVYPFHGVGGLERSTHDLIRHLLAAGARVTLITQPPFKAQTDRWAPDGLTCRFVPYRTFPLAGRAGTTILDRSTAYPLFGLLAGRLAEELALGGAIDLVYGLGASTLGYALARRSRIPGLVPFVMNPQGIEEFGGVDGRYGGVRLKAVGYAPLRRVVRACADQADRVIATDQALVALLERHLRVGADRMRLVPNAVDVPACDAMAGRENGNRIRSAHGISPNEVILLSAGRLERNKGFHVLVEALATLQDLPWRWVVVGDGPFRGRLEQRLAASGLRHRADFVGRVSDADLHAWYEAASLFVHPTLYEGSSLVTLEAMTHRLPVVATTAGGLPDKVQPGRTGWLVPPGDGAALASALRTALASAQALPAMGVAGRALVEAEFSWTRSVARMLAVFSELTDVTTK
jgi:glycogen(starch) synthase